MKPTTSHEASKHASTTYIEHTQHYVADDSATAISAALTALGKANSRLTVEDIAIVDQFHSGGTEATRALAKQAMIKPTDRVLDVGGAYGGPARMLAHEIGCHVTVVDLTETYCRIGEKLTELVGLTDRVQFQQGNALDLPFEAGSFDVVWTQHASMNISDKRLLYTQIQRVLRTGGRLALHEVTAGSGEPLHFPVPWAHSEATSFLQSPNAFRDTVTQAGFRELQWNDITDWTLAWFQARQTAQSNLNSVVDGLGLLRLLGPDAGVMTRNFAINAKEGHVRVVQSIFERV